MARPIILISHLYRLADTISFRKDYSPPSSPPSRPFQRAGGEGRHNAIPCPCERAAARRGGERGGGAHAGYGSGRAGGERAGDTSGSAGAGTGGLVDSASVE